MRRTQRQPRSPCLLQPSQLRLQRLLLPSLQRESERLHHLQASPVWRSGYVVATMRSMCCAAQGARPAAVKPSAARPAAAVKPAAQNSDSLCHLQASTVRRWDVK